MNPSGIIPALSTITDDSGQLDLDGIRSVARFNIDSKVHAVAVSIVAGEFYKFSDEERKRIYEIVVDEANGEVPVWAGVSHMATEPAIQLAKQAKDAGADGLIAMPPLAGKEASFAMDRHFSAILERVELPLIIQDAEDFSNVSIPAALVARLTQEFDNLVCVKVEGPNTLQKTRDLRILLGERMSILGGMAARLLFEEIEAGSNGNIPGSCFPDLLVNAYRRYVSGNHQSARKLFSAYEPWLSFMAKNIMSAAEIEKETLRINGVIKSSSTREPRVPLSSEAKRELETICDSILEATKHAW